MLRITLFITICVTILAAAEVATIVTSISPLQAGPLQLEMFFTSLWVCLTGIMVFIWHAIKQRAIYRFRNVSILVSLRQAALFSGLVVLSLFFNALHILTLWDIVPLILSALLIEFFFQAETSVLPRNHEPVHRS